MRIFFLHMFVLHFIYIFLFNISFPENLKLIFTLILILFSHFLWKKLFFPQPHFDGQNAKPLIWKNTIFQETKKMCFKYFRQCWHRRFMPSDLYVIKKGRICGVNLVPSSKCKNPRKLQIGGIVFWPFVFCHIMRWEKISPRNVTIALL